jgi:hypothetical protein
VQGVPCVVYVGKSVSQCVLPQAKKAKGAKERSSPKMGGIEKHDVEK